MWHQLSQVTVNAIPALVIALITLALGWLLGNRIASRWEEVKKRRALELEALGRFYQLYGEFHGLWKLWNVHKKNSEYLTGYQRDPEMAWRLLERVTDIEGGFESLLVRLTQERALGPNDIDQLARFREAYQCLRESIRDDRALDWKAKLSHGESALKYQEFKRLASYVASLLSNPDYGIVLRRIPPSPSLLDAAAALLNATSVEYRGKWWIRNLEPGVSLTAASQDEDSGQ